MDPVLVPGSVDAAAARVRLPWRRRIGPVIALMVLAPWAAECSWGGFALADVPVVVLVLAPLYGGAAVLIRETARRVGGGWPMIVLLAAAFGFVQAGLVDQGLFNPDYLDDTEFAGTAGPARMTWFPWLEFSAQQAFGYIGNHIALSICAPIAIVESFVRGEHRRQAWLGTPGLVVVVVLYLLGSLLVFSDDTGRKNFVASPVQLSFAILTILALIGLAMLPRWRRQRSPVAAGAPRLIWVGLVVVVARLSELGNGWGWLLLSVAVTGLAAAMIVRWSRRTGWGQRHVLAAWSACLIAAAAIAYVIPNYAPASPAEALIGDIAISVITLALVGGALWRVRAAGLSRPEAPAVAA